MLGTKELNKALQNVLNSESKDEKTNGDRVFKVADRVMQIKNNYDIYWEKENEVGTGIFNGEIGKITAIDENTKQIEVLFDDGKTAWYEFGDLDQIEHAYCLTIHKSQRERISSCNSMYSTGSSNATYKKFIVYWNYKSKRTFNNGGK